MKGSILVVYLLSVTAYTVAAGKEESYMATFSANLHDKPAARHMQFDITTINRGNNLDESIYNITVSRDGVYMGLLSVGASFGLVTDMTFYEFTSLAFTCRRKNQSQARHDTYGRDVLIWLRSGTILTAGNRFHSFSTPTGLLTSWGTTSLPPVVDNIVAFTVSRPTEFMSGTMSYPNVHFNIGNGWDLNNSRFVVPKSGTYFFSYAVYVQGGVKIDFKLKINDNTRINIYRMSTSHTDNDSVGRSAVLALTAGDRVEIGSDYPGISNANNHTTLSGFLYEPPVAQRFAWGAYRTSVWIPDSEQVTYDLVLVNDGFVWEDNHVTCHVSGVYYVYVSAGLMANTPVEPTVMKNIQPMGKLLRDDISHNGVDTFGRSMLIECSVDDRLWVSAAPGTELYSNLNLQTSFCGFYINP